MTLLDNNLKLAFCLQRESDKIHPHNLHSSPEFCSNTYSPNGRLLDLFSLSPSLIDVVLKSLTDLFNSKDRNIALPEPNFLWISSSKL